MATLRLGIVGYRGMVGSVLIERMLAEKDFNHFNTSLFSTSQVGSEAPSYSSETKVFDANNLMELAKMDIILTCQGGDYTKAIYSPLRKLGWTGYWIDAASALRMDDEAVLVLDPVNLNVIKTALKEGKKTYVGANCTVSLMLLALDGLFKRQAIEWVSSMTYQAASGAGAKNMRELLSQMQNIGDQLRPEIDNVAGDILALEKNATQLISSNKFPTENFGHPLALNLLPWIDVALPSGQSKEEWKAQVEANKIMATKKTIPVDGTCVRVSALRCHSQGLTVKLNQKIPLNEVEGLLKDSHQWLKFVDNNKEATLKELCPRAISGTLDIGIGRVRKMTLGDDYLNVYTVGDQLLWGAAEPLRRMLHLINDRS
ncbi:MAG: aspartate-semialdehyde dehydrogenase [Bdellovibrionales bacterium]|nr:aspartate-semialdehyde dehydrogenase [Bdellovibrionales bacterium]